jgi:hypothetical protein
MVSWEACFHPEYETQSEAQSFMMSLFMENHRGYLWRELIAAQCYTPGQVEFAVRTGAYLWDPHAGGYTSKLRSDPSELIAKPHVLGLTRDLELKRQDDWGVSWVGALFHHSPPILGLDPSEQRLLTCALPGVTDEQLAATLGISVAVVKKRWVSIYRGLKDRLPDLVPNSFQPDTSMASRGKEKRRRLLAYLREHPEELRPTLRSRPQNSTDHSKNVLSKPE